MPAAAQESGTAELGAFGRYTVFDSSLNLKNKFGVGGRLGLFIIPNLAIEGDEGVHFERAWMDPVLGKVFCLASGPSKEAVMRVHERAGHPTPEVYEVTIEV